FIPTLLLAYIFNPLPSAPGFYSVRRNGCLERLLDSRVQRRQLLLDLLKTNWHSAFNKVIGINHGVGDCVASLEARHWLKPVRNQIWRIAKRRCRTIHTRNQSPDRKSTRLNSSHVK